METQASGDASDGFVSESSDDDDRWVTPPSRERNFSPWASTMLELATFSPAESVPTVAASVPGWRARTRGRLTDLFGQFPRTVSLNPEITDTVDCGSYTRERIVFDVEATMSVPAYLLVPKTRRRQGPAVIAIHGHGPGKDHVAGVVAGTDVPQATPDAYAHQLVEAGYVVLAPDMRGFGERADWVPDGKYFCDANLVAAAAAGRNPLTANIHDLVGAMNLLEEHPLVDPSRIGVVGFSYGATLALFLAAWDTRLRTAVVSGYFSSWHSAHRVPHNLCGSQVLFGMLGVLEHVDLAALVAPRALLIESGDEDPLFPVGDAREALVELESVYHAMRAPSGALEHHVFAGDHRFDGSTMLRFLERWL
ncbi:MAG: dienelactone hydrolase family protein [Acidimicrobiia bacterium]|nr:dienelactone hydrolase family protein [Acidimicrobiia bacterium]